MQRLLFGVVAAFSLLLPGCGGEDGGGSDDTGEREIDCDNEAVPSYSEVRAFGVCTNCHSSDNEGVERNGAPPSLNFDSHDGAASAAPRIVNQVSMGSMPPATSGFSLTSGEKRELFVWAECGTPE
ncbi:MAG TPA: hypothetical protein VI197_10200 [Polyangiaceae bacterium]